MRIGLRSVAILAGLAAILCASELNPPEVQVLIEDMLEHAYRQEYNAAAAGLDQLKASYPDNPAGDFFTGAYWQLYMFDHGTDSLEMTFLDCMKSSQDNALRIADQTKDARAKLYAGATYVYRAIYYGWKGDYWNVFRQGIKAPPYLKAAYDADSTLTDACLGLGVAEYFQYSAGRYLTGLHLFGSWDRAVALVRKAIDGEGYFAITAKYTLAWMMTQEKRFGEAHSLLRELLDSYPEDRMFRRQLRDTYFAERDYDSAIAVGEALASELDSLQPDNTAGIAENYLSLAKNLFRNGDRERAAQYCDAIIAFDGRGGSAVRLDDYVKEARALKQKL